MDSLITAAGRALAAGDPLGALNRVALRDDAPALALRGIALAQLGDFPKARDLVRRAARAFGAAEPIAKARCIVAEAEIALVSRDLHWPSSALDAAQRTLTLHGDAVNAAYAGYLAIRRLLLVGQLEAAERMLAALDPAPMPPALRAAHGLVVAGLAIRRVQASKARVALAAARRDAEVAGIPALSAEIAAATEAMDAPAARLMIADGDRVLSLDDVEELFQSRTFLIDTFRHEIRQHHIVVSLATRPVLFKLMLALAAAWPADVARDSLLAQAFGARSADESHRVRLRVEIGRLRMLLSPLAELTATRHGYRLTPHRARQVAVLAPPQEQPYGHVVALLTDGEAWSSSALALALGVSQRSIQRALDQLAATGVVEPIGRGRARRWSLSAGPGLATVLLLPLSLPDR